MSTTNDLSGTKRPGCSARPHLHSGLSEKTSISIAARVALLALIAVFFNTHLHAGADTGQAVDAARDGPIFATVGETVITRTQFEDAYNRALRQRFYHFEPPEAQRIAFRREVADGLIDRILLVREARRRGLKSDDAQIQHQLQSYQNRYAGNPRWENESDQMLSALKTYLTENDLLEQLKRQVENIQEPTEAVLEAFYEARPQTFTEPERQKLSLILLKVDPSSSSTVWDAATREAERLIEQLRTGTDFAELAMMHSADESSARGGDMGYLHAGMLTEGAQSVVNELEIGAISAPVRLLEGVAIFRVEDRKPATLLTYAKVRQRAKDLWLREEANTAWTALTRRLRTETSIEIHDVFAENQ